MSGAVRPTCALFCIAALAVMAWRHPADLLAHARTALLASTRLARGLYMAHTLFAGLCLGLLFQHLGLLVAIGLHVLIDWAGLTLLHARTQDLDPGVQPA